MWCLNWFWAMYGLFHKALVSKNVYIRYMHTSLLIPYLPFLNCNFVYKNHFVALIDALFLELFLVTDLTFQ
jgi:hypothetical protein